MYALNPQSTAHATLCIIKWEITKRSKRCFEQKTHLQKNLNKLKKN